jgi:hypothetical protein
MGESMEKSWFLKPCMLWEVGVLEEMERGMGLKVATGYMLMFLPYDIYIWFQEKRHLIFQI